MHVLFVFVIGGLEIQSDVPHADHLLVSGVTRAVPAPFFLVFADQYRVEDGYGHDEEHGKNRENDEDEQSDD